MLPFLTVDGLTYRTPDGRTLFQNLTFAVERGRLGLVGPNGCGKTSLLRLLLGELIPTGGSVTARGRIGALRQAFAPDPDSDVATLLGVAEAYARLSRVEAGVASDLDLELADWDVRERVAGALADVGLGGLDPSAPADDLSGGEATRVNLARLLIDRPEIILLDEPTNNLDSSARRLVGDLLAQWRGAAVVVSHDRALLRGMDRILDVGREHGRAYGGGYDLYAARRAEEDAAAERDLEVALREAKRVQREIQATRERQDRRDASGLRAKARKDQPKIVLGAMARRAETTRGGQDRLAERRLTAAQASLGVAREKVDRSRALAFALPPSGLAEAKLVLAFEEVSFGWPARPPFLRAVSFRLVGPRRLAVVGGNGAGKTTLLRLALGDLEPTSGQVRRGAPSVALDQRAAVLRDDQSLLDNYRRLNPAAGENTAHLALARFLFRNTAARAPAGSLSGGERLRAALACVLMADTPPQLIALDEPTNHLDLDSIAAMESALAAFDGALLVVSHDQDFLDAIGVDDRIVLSPRPSEDA